MNCDIYFKTWLSLEISVSFRLNSYHFLMTGWRWNYEGWFSFLFFLFSSSSLFWNSWFKNLGNCLYNILDFSSFISFISRWSFPFQHWHFSKCKPEKKKVTENIWTWISNGFERCKKTLNFLHSKHIKETVLKKKLKFMSSLLDNVPN